MKPHEVAHAIHHRPVFPDVVRAVGYGQIPCAEVTRTLQSIIEAHGRDAVDAAARELLDYEPQGGVLYAKLKTSLHVHARPILGPMPSEWATWWQNADGTDRKGKPKVWPPKLRGLPPMSKEEKDLRELTLPALADRLHAARRHAATLGPRGRAATKAQRDVGKIESEYVRRGLCMPLTTPAVAETGFGSLDDRQLEASLHERRWRAAKRGPIAKQAKAEVPAIEAEFRRRDLTIPSPHRIARKKGAA